MPNRLRDILAALMICVGCNRGQDGVDMVARFYDNYNSYRIPAVLQMVTDDIGVRGWDGSFVTGSAAMRSRIEWDSVVGTHMRPGTLLTRGDTVLARNVIETSSWLQSLGIGLIEYETVEFVLRDGQIAEINVGSIMPTRRQILREGLEGFLPWAQHEYPERLRRVRPNGQFVYEPRRAADWLSLISEWEEDGR